jgi:hypothetical protein
MSLYLKLVETSHEGKVIMLWNTAVQADRTIPDNKPDIIIRDNEKGTSDFFFFSFGVLQLMLPEAPQPYGLLYYPRIGTYNLLHQFRAVTPPKHRNLEL